MTGHMHSEVARRRCKETVTGPSLGYEPFVPPEDEELGANERQHLITEGSGLSPLSKGAIGPYQLQAAIAAVHDEAAHTEETD